MVLTVVVTIAQIALCVIMAVLLFSFSGPCSENADWTIVCGLDYAWAGWSFVAAGVVLLVPLVCLTIPNLPRARIFQGGAILAWAIMVAGSLLGATVGTPSRIVEGILQLSILPGVIIALAQLWARKGNEGNPRVPQSLSKP